MIKMRSSNLVVLMTSALLLTSQNETKAQDQGADLSAFEVIEWTQLMPKEDLEALQNPPDYIMDIEEGSEEDKVVNQGELSTDMFFDDEYQRALLSTTVVPEMNGKAIRIPGFIVPLEFNDDKTVSQFFLVPFFGACIHVPPPPPNQVIHVTSSNGVELENLYTPHWISGVVNSIYTENEIATATYAMDAISVEVYWEK
ncbi:MAG: hypothetical protein CBB82_02115 [Betaproteobacteria bacterium TMED22]|nr:MAG: hypothetical protein CBB82_02115 [Betaproteobacteria bacterium TMED22]